MLQVKVTISPDFITKLEYLKQLHQDDVIMRTVASTMLAKVHDRIHVQGLNSSGSSIGRYSKGYMVVRTGNFRNAGTFSKGKHKGDLKNAGVFTKGAHKGEQRPKYNRTADETVIISLTRQMENDFKVVATEEGYGLGYSNPENFKKAGYVEATYNQKIFELTEEERELAVEIAKEEIMKIFNQ